MTDWKSINFKTPLFAASGCFGYGPEYQWADLSALGGIFSKGVTLLPRPGNPYPRLAETPCGLINSIGLENFGIDGFLTEKSGELLKVGLPVFVNIEGDTPEDYVLLAEKIDRSRLPFAGLELNISCPNVERGGMELGTDPATVRRILAEVRQTTSLPLIAKLTPNATSVVDLAEAALAGGADALTLTNTVLAMSIDVKTRKPRLGTRFGGLSGPAVKPIILRIVYQVYHHLKPVIFASGGITSPADLLEFLFAGATFFQVGTALFRNPNVFSDLWTGLTDYLQKEGIRDYLELRGCAHP
jgi:dihydroorotate dehydrogenase (NAD+) catalytic subunit